MLVLEGTFDGKTIVPDEPLTLPTGTRLRLRVFALPSPEMVKSQHEIMKRLAENATDDASMPVDYAANIDHYLYGIPKQP